MRKIFLIAIVLCVSIVYAQDKEKVQYVENGGLTEVTYFYENGVIRQEGTFNKEGKLHGLWASYDINGEKVAIGEYADGKKVGKWMFWSKDNVVREVDYSNSKIVIVSKREPAF